ncbi:MAG: pilus assembly protein [Candidatus Sericytochromatia bacterium]|nr:pilus assembly protein [Candidatus Tanganyikabacteria bacterium]
MRQLQRGQAMVEFTMVLPLLLLLSFGTLEIGLYLQRRLVAGGASFVAARAAAVQGPRAQSATVKIFNTYAQDSKSRWVAELAGTAKVGREGGRLLRIGVSRDGDTWTGALTGSVQLLGGRLDPQAKWRTEYPISAEYIPGGTSGRSYAVRPTDLMVDYRAKVPLMDQLPDLGSLLRKIPDVGGSEVGLALDPRQQAAMANPQDRNGSPSPSKKYISPYAEEKEFRHAEKLANGIQKLARASEVFFVGCQTALVTGEPNAVAACKAVGEPFTAVDKAVHFEKVADRLEDVVYALYMAKRPRSR